MQQPQRLRPSPPRLLRLLGAPAAFTNLTLLATLATLTFLGVAAVCAAAANAATAATVSADACGSRPPPVGELSRIDERQQVCRRVDPPRQQLVGLREEGAVTVGGRPQLGESKLRGPALQPPT